MQGQGGWSPDTPLASGRETGAQSQSAPYERPLPSAPPELSRNVPCPACGSKSGQALSASPAAPHSPLPPSLVPAPPPPPRCRRGLPSPQARLSRPHASCLFVGRPMDACRHCGAPALRVALHGPPRRHPQQPPHGPLPRTPGPVLLDRLSELQPVRVRQWLWRSAGRPLCRAVVTVPRNNQPPTAHHRSPPTANRQPPQTDHRQPPTAANRQPLFNTVSVVLCLAHVLTLKQRMSP